jgi:hypothetical protein
MAGVTGPTGATGAAGVQGATGATGPRGPAIGTSTANGNGWNYYREYNFNSSSNDILYTDSSKAQDVAAYMDRYPNSRIGIDGSNQNRVNNVRNALMNAGVPSNRIQMGSFGESQYRHDSRVLVLVSS